MGLDEEGTTPPWMFKAAAALCVLFAVLATALALLNPTPEARRETTLSFDRPQLVVFESQSCGWCLRFRQHVAPAYEKSPLENRAPLRYVDVSQQRTAGYRLARRVTGTPTFVLVDTQGREVSRIPGLPGGKDEFVQAIEQMLAKLADTERG
ncbi:MAG: thioredoxin fold domain-containing protein [Hyphomicrobiaceae bacterium]